MYPTYNRLQLLFLIIFLVISAGLLGYQALYVWPRKACEARGDWWDPQGRVCAVPMPLTHWTGRPLGSPPLSKPSAPPASPAPAK